MLHSTKNDDGEIEDISGLDAFMHFVTIGWKVLFAIVPPSHYYGGVPCFLSSLVFIGIVTYVVGEIAGLFGCVLNIKPSVTAITFVALGTSLPDTFASGSAALAEKYADSAVGNVTGSNSVNVFLGLGLPWVIATIWEGKTSAAIKGYDPTKYAVDGVNMGWGNSNYYVPSNSLGFSCAVFCFCALICISIVVARRFILGGELGGTHFGRTLTTSVLVALWVFYIIMSIAQAYELFGLHNLTMGINMKV
jgi:solute carrier family 8 (sodium/calcium exchanger)